MTEKITNTPDRRPRSTAQIAADLLRQYPKRAKDALPLSWCQSIYAGCCVVPSARCRPCERINGGKSTRYDELERKN